MYTKEVIEAENSPAKIATPPTDKEEFSEISQIKQTLLSAIALTADGYSDDDSKIVQLNSFETLRKEKIKQELYDFIQKISQEEITPTNCFEQLKKCFIQSLNGHNLAPQLKFMIDKIDLYQSDKFEHVPSAELQKFVENEIIEFLKSNPEIRNQFKLSDISTLQKILVGLYQSNLRKKLFDFTEECFSQDRKKAVWQLENSISAKFSNNYSEG